MSFDGPESLEDFDESPRPAKKRRTTKVRGDSKAKTNAGHKKAKYFKDSVKSAEFVHDSESDGPVSPPGKSPAKKTAQTRPAPSSCKTTDAPDLPQKKASRRKTALTTNDDAGEPSTRTRKSKSKARLSRTLSSDSEDAFESADVSKSIRRPIRVVEDDLADKPAAKKPKHRVYEPSEMDRFRPMFVSQAPPPESSDPANLRGEIWIKQPSPIRQPQSMLPPARKPPTGPPKRIRSVPPTAPPTKSTQVPTPPNPSLGGTTRNVMATREDCAYSAPMSDTSIAGVGRNTSNSIASAVSRSRTLPFITEDDEIDSAETLVQPTLAASTDREAPGSFRKPSWTLAGQDLRLGKENASSTLQKICDKSSAKVSNGKAILAPVISGLATDLRTSPAPRKQHSQHVTKASGSANFDRIVSDAIVVDELADLPSDAFSSEPEDCLSVAPKPTQQPQKLPGLGGLSTGYRQTTLSGAFANAAGEQSKAKKTAWPLAERDEKATHHILDADASSTWVYPINLGVSRDYQYNIVHTGLFHNLLVALPTGLGKTFIAATIMLNWFRWTKDAQIVFVAPTKPLVAQQVDACFHTVGIPRSQTAMLTGNISPALRAEAWEQKRVFFMTPQTMANDLRSGACDPKRLVLLVVDEAHRATGNYAYVDIVSFLRRFNTSFRVLALTATPGAKIETVQQVIDGLNISRVEIRTETSLDIRQYVHARETDTFLFDYSEEQEMIMDLFSKAVKPVLDKLNGQNAYWLKDPTKLTAYGLTQAQRQWTSSEAGKKAPWPLKSMVMTSFQVLASLAHAMSMLKFHGISCFFRKIAAFKRDLDESGSKMKAANEIRKNENFVKMFNYIQGWVNNPDFIGHPKLEYLREVILNHFLDAGEGNRSEDTPSSTRVMVFAQYRDSAEHIAKVLKRNDPMIRPRVFVGQATAEGSAGMDQKTQLDVIEKFKAGTFNTLVATSIGEEGLDIGEVDLIICYDASASPIRMLQRMGRTGRKRKGRIVLLLMRDKEERDFAQAKDNYEKMQGMIASGKHFTFHDDRSPRILPKDVKPVVEKRVVEIPVENSQADLPMPTRAGKKKKRPAKKFHMPDGVVTGFVKASRVSGDGSDVEIAEDTAASDSRQHVRKAVTKTKAQSAPPPEPEAIPLPFLQDALLNKIQERELTRKYQYVSTTDEATAVVQAPMPERNLAGFRCPGPVARVQHGRFTNSVAATLDRMHNVDGVVLEQWREMQQEDGPFEDDSSPATNKTLEQPRPMEHQTDMQMSDSDADLPTLPAPAPQRVAPVARKPPRQPVKAPKQPKTASKSKRGTRTTAAPPRSSAMEALASSPPPTPREFAMPSQAETLGSADTSGDEMQDQDAWQHDSDLASFVAGSDEPIAWASSSQGVLGLIDGSSVPRQRQTVRIEVESSDEDEDVGTELQEKVRKRKRVVESDSDE
ncbi:hypothetical protein ANO11243_040170 [Dothideomycetidae sp. 11243]|nr:hypothetical protein ANO11243_040170 [fungal sp. No.11243]